MNVLLITGCIKPDPRVPYVTVDDVGQRLLEYKETIRWAIEETDFRYIIFVDNSGYALSVLDDYKMLADKNDKCLELLSYKADNDILVDLGKGYGEGDAIKYALLNSQLSSQKGITFFYKLTGRLKIGNIEQVCQGVSSEMPRFLLNYPYADMIDTRFYGISLKGYYKHFLNVHTLVDDKNWHCLEHVFFEVCKREKIRYRSFPAYPHFIGRSGSTGKIYTDDKNYALFDRLCRNGLFNKMFVMKILDFMKKNGILT